MPPMPELTVTPTSSGSISEGTMPDWASACLEAASATLKSAAAMPVNVAQAAASAARKTAAAPKAAAKKPAAKRSAAKKAG